MSRYDRLIKLTNDNHLFECGSYFNKDEFKRRLNEKGLLQLFDHIYRADTNCSGPWLMWDFSDRFDRFAHALCQTGYCSKMGSGCYYKN